METLPDSRQALWLKITQRVQVEWLVLDEEDRSWITRKINRLVTVQKQLHALVSVAEGEAICCDCVGACCGHGLYHPTLVTVLAHLATNTPLPNPDFKQSCPYLGETGCRFLPIIRPYNCLTFICELIEDRFSDKQRQSVLALELELRGIYEVFDSRYVGSSLRGLMNRPPGDNLHSYLKRQDVLN